MGSSRSVLVLEDKILWSLASSFLALALASIGGPASALALKAAGLGLVSEVPFAAKYYTIIIEFCTGMRFRTHPTHPHRRLPDPTVFPQSSFTSPPYPLTVCPIPIPRMLIPIPPDRENARLAVWCSGNTLVLINAVALHRVRLVMRWVTAFGQVNYLTTQPATQANSTIPPWVCAMSTGDD